MSADEEPAFADALALLAAADAHGNHFEKSRGVWAAEDIPSTVVLFNNTPYAADPAARERETARIRARLRAEGIKELAYATYPPEGEGAGHTYAMVLRADEGQRERLVQLVMEETAKTMAELGGDSAN
jgi:hypothetical protein